MQETETVPIADDAISPRAGAPAAAKPTLDDYPESDGRPMAETQWHMWAMFDAIGALREHFRDRDDVYVAGNMMMYYVEDDTRTSVSPDVFVTFGVPRLPERGVWRTWVEGGRFADFVLEVTSKSTRREDEGRKRDLYARLGVREYWQFDPDGDYLDPMLKGRRLDAAGEYAPLVLQERDGALCGDSLLGLELRLAGDRLRLFDPARDCYLLTHSEKEAALAEKDAALAEKRATLAETREALANKREALANKRAALANKRAALESAETARDRAETSRDQETRRRRSAEAGLRAAEAEIVELKRRLRLSGG